MKTSVKHNKREKKEETSPQKVKKKRKRLVQLSIFDIEGVEQGKS